MALRKGEIKDEASLGSLKAYSNTRASDILNGIPELGVKFEVDVDAKELPCLSEFLDHATDSMAALSMPEKALKGNSGWCLDIVTPLNRRTSCFTSAYGRYNRGTGSVLYQDETREFHLLDPENREFDEKWSSTLDLSRLRYFSGAEMALLMGFSPKFSFPPSFTQKQQWKLIGNSLNVRIASKVVELGLRLMKFAS
jgi:tRNA (cytosine38-C5)-methyltransferase